MGGEFAKVGLATTGDEPAWRSVAGSPGHQAIPIASAEHAAHLPTMLELVHQLGIDPEGAWPSSSRDSAPFGLLPSHALHLVEPADDPDDPEDALAQRHGIRSVLGFGGQLPAGDLFAVVLFTRVAVGAEARRLFKTLALAVKVGVMDFARGPIFS